MSESPDYRTVRTAFCYLGLWLVKIRTMSAGLMNNIRDMTKMITTWSARNSVKAMDDGRLKN